MSITYSLYNQQQAHKAMGDLWQRIKPYIAAGHRLQVTVRKEKRSKDQNSKLWAILEDISKQLNWHGHRLTAEEWKCVISAALKRQRVVPGIDGGFVVLGLRTSEMGKEDMSELIELAIAFAVENEVKLGG